MIANILVPLDRPCSRFCFQNTPTSSNQSLWIDAAISAAAILGSALLSKSSNSSTNNLNRYLTMTGRDWQEKMLQKQMDYNTDMWNKDNEYNSASNQRKRLEEAGLNPYLMMNGGENGRRGRANPRFPWRISFGEEEVLERERFSVLGQNGAKSRLKHSKTRQQTRC